MDLVHIDGKPYVLVPLHDYRRLTGQLQMETGDLPQEVSDALAAEQEHPVKIIRHHRGLTQKDLAVACGMSRPYLAEIETGKKAGSLAAIKMLASALNVSPALLMTD